MGLNDWSRAMLLSSHPTHSPTFSGKGGISPRSFLLIIIRLQGTGVSTDRTGIALVHESQQTLELEYVSAYSFLGLVQSLQTDGTIVWCFKNSVGPVVPVKGIQYRLRQFDPRGHRLASEGFPCHTGQQVEFRFPILNFALTMSYMKDKYTFVKVAFFYHKKDADTFLKCLQDFRHRLLALQPSKVLPLNLSYQDLLTQHLKQ
ncbi:hypothetical protein NPIL_215491 [Nephila pilipes]|uniref:Uncharacterized protein n=1 Tax=Nephila pilipes TaxID=299642 RepID=A0A8X6P8S8_NEPPI|nr:hypothetical protein NPIL_215491 [Nephila pilipes]